MPKEVVYNEEMRRGIQSGVDTLVNTVKTTLGPKGRNVVINEASGVPLVTNDGATIAKEIKLADNIEDMGMRLIKEIALKTKDEAGDGTTTAMLLAQFILREGNKNIISGANPVELKKGIQGATQLAAAAIRKLAIRVETREMIAQVAATSVADPVIGEMIAEAMDSVGKDGVITVDKSEGRDTFLEVKEGMQLDVGYLSGEMVTDKNKMIAELDNPYILITNRKIADPQELLPVLEQVAKQSRPLLIVAESVEGGALGMLVINKRNGVLNSVAIRPPAYGDGRKARMEDLATLTGATFMDETLGYVLKDTTLDMLGSAASVRVDKKSTVIIGGTADKKLLEAKVGHLRELIKKTEYDFDRKQLEERLAKLGGGVAIIHVGAVTETEMKEKKQRIENALNTAQAAIAEGIVPGGGITYLSILPALKAYVASLSGDMKTGATIVLKSMSIPTFQIAENAGKEGSTVVAKIKQQPIGIGFNVLTEEYTNMVAAGVVDSARVLRLALQSAASVSAVLLTVEVGITDTKN